MGSRRTKTLGAPYHRESVTLRHEWAPGNGSASRILRGATDAGHDRFPEMRSTSLYEMVALSFIPLCTVDGPITPPKVVGRGGGVVQKSYPVTGTVRGERLSGNLRGTSSYDWMSGPPGIGTVRVIANIETDDGMVIPVNYEGRADITNGFEKSRGIASPVFGATDLKYLWLNVTQVIARGFIEDDRIHWDWYQVVEEG